MVKPGGKNHPQSQSICPVPTLNEPLHVHSTHCIDLWFIILPFLELLKHFNHVWFCQINGCGALEINVGENRDILVFKPANVLQSAQQSLLLFFFNV